MGSNILMQHWSRAASCAAHTQSSQETWARRHEDAWRYFGGAFRYVVQDNLSTSHDSVIGHTFLYFDIQAYFTAVPEQSTPSPFFNMSLSIVTRASCARRRNSSICSGEAGLSPAP